MSVIFTNGSLIDGRSDAVREACDVIIEGDRIVAIEDTKDRGGGDDTVIDCTGRGIMPGLIDCHTHYLADPRSTTPFDDAINGSDAAAVLRGARNARVALEAGITTTRGAGAPRQLNFALRDAINAGDIPGPRMLAPGEAITITGGHGMKFGCEVDGLVELQKAARRQMRDGADILKIIASEAAMLNCPEAAVEELTSEELDVLVGEARRRGLHIFSHAQNSTSVIRSAKAGVDSVEHAFLANKTAIDTLAECGTTLVPTLSVCVLTLETQQMPPRFEKRMLELRDANWASCELAIRTGVKVAAGTDCGMPGVEPDMLWREVQLLHERGLSVMNALRAGTIWAAELLGISADVGSIEPGKQADVIVIDGDPLDDLVNLQKVDLVMKEGKVVAGNGGRAA